MYKMRSQKCNCLFKYEYLLHEIKNYEKAREYGEEAINANPEWAKAWARTAEAYYYLNDMEKANNEIEICIQLEKDNQTYINLQNKITNKIKNEKANEKQKPIDKEKQKKKRSKG
eukprot:UN28258